MVTTMLLESPQQSHMPSGPMSSDTGNKKCWLSELEIIKPQAYLGFNDRNMVRKLVEK
jgi:hypothetical protein